MREIGVFKKNNKNKDPKLHSLLWQRPSAESTPLDKYN